MNKSIMKKFLLVFITLVVVIAVFVFSMNQSERYYIIVEEGLSLAVTLPKENGSYTVPDSAVEIIVDNGHVKVFWGDQEIPGTSQSKSKDYLRDNNFIIF